MASAKLLFTYGLLMLSVLVGLAMSEETACPDGSKIILVAAASANTGSKVVQQLAGQEGVTVRAMFRNVNDERAAPLKSLPGVTIVQGDFEKPETIAAALKGVDRALLVTSAFTRKQFEYETSFLAAAADEGIEAVVRIGTATSLTHPGTTCCYGRAHHGIESFTRFHKYPVVTIRSDWFFTNMLFAAEEGKSTGKISIPGPPDAYKTTMVDPEDVAAAAVLILLSPKSTLKQFIAAEIVEVHGSEHLSFADQAKALSKSVGYTIEYQEVPADAWVNFAVSIGMDRLFAQSFGDTYRTMTGSLTPMVPHVFETSPLLIAQGYETKSSLEKWANKPETIAAFKK